MTKTKAHPVRGEKGKKKEGNIGIERGLLRSSS